MFHYINVDKDTPCNVEYLHEVSKSHPFNGYGDLLVAVESIRDLLLLYNVTANFHLDDKKFIVFRRDVSCNANHNLSGYGTYFLRVYLIDVVKETVHQIHVKNFIDNDVLAFMMFMDARLKHIAAINSFQIAD